MEKCLHNINLSDICPDCEILEHASLERDFRTFSEQIIAKIAEASKLLKEVNELGLENNIERVDQEVFYCLSDEVERMRYGWQTSTGNC